MVMPVVIFFMKKDRFCRRRYCGRLNSKTAGNLKFSAVFNLFAFRNYCCFCFVVCVVDLYPVFGRDREVIPFFPIELSVC